MSWRRKPDGRPYADIIANGKRRRLSLLLPGERTINDDEAQRRHDRLAASVEHDPCQPDKTTNSIDDLCRWYCQTVMPARGNRQTTRRQNRVIYERFTSYLRSQGVETVDQLSGNPGVLDDYVVWRQAEARATTINKELTVFRAVFRAAYDRGILDAVPGRKWPRVKVADRDIGEPISREDFTRLLNALSESVHYNAVRFVAFTGCRPCDAANLQRTHLHDLDGAQPMAVLIQQKTGKRVAIALSPPAVEAVRDALQVSQGFYVFTGRNGRPVTSTNIQCAIAHKARQLGIVASAKTFRRSLVSRLYDAGADDLLVARITGHRSQAIHAYRQLRQGAAHDLAKVYADTMLGVTPENVTPLSPPAVSPCK